MCSKFPGYGGGKELGLVTVQGFALAVRRQFVQSGVEEDAGGYAAFFENLVGFGFTVKPPLAEVGPVRCVLRFGHEVILGSYDLCRAV